MKRYCLSIVAVTLLFTSGCVVIANNGPKPCPAPDMKDRVGGGVDILYILPEDGTVVLVDSQSGKTVQTQSRDKNETFVFKANSFGKEFYEGMGIDLKKANFVLYFYPSNPKPPVPPQPPVAPQAPQP